MTDVLKLDSIEIELAGGLSLMVWGAGVGVPDDYDKHRSPGGPLRFCGKSYSEGSSRRVPIEYHPEYPNEGAQALVLYENTNYRWRVKGAGADSVTDDQIHSTLKNTALRRSMCEWSQEQCKGEAPGGSFRITNYLGTAEIAVGHHLGSTVRFEVQSRKFDYHGEYSAMVEDIADHCRHLLLEWDSPTSFTISQDSTRQAETLLEQFLFMRHLTGGDKLDFHLEMIARRPHSTLEHEDEWRPAPLADPVEFAVNPFRNSRGWTANVQEGVFSVSGSSPTEILHRNRQETNDTPPNRFVLFALTAFRDLCDEIVKINAVKQGTAYLEALRMRESLDAFLARPFFRDVSPLDRLPLESQTLQKREGYRDILQSWLMLELATKLDWPGRGEAYDGSNRDAASLYEYWLYFILLDVLKKRLGMVPSNEAPESDTFVSAGSRGGPMVNLEKGKESVSRFVWDSGDGRKMGVHFFYNRKFTKALDPKASGSYSQAFWPDYTLAFFPWEYMGRGGWKKAEEAALEKGEIAFLHFDAKYRLDFREGEKSLFGSDDEETLKTERSESRGSDTYKRGDLYKMHTYNDAIRRTAGSYVLFPGQDGAPMESFPRYEEVAPGVGAFRMRPGNAEQRGKCEAVLADFISDVLRHHGNSFSRNYRINYWTEKTIQETPAARPDESKDFSFDQRPSGDEEVLLSGYRSFEIAELGKRHGFAFLHAIDEHGNPNPKVPPRLLEASMFLPYTFEDSEEPKWCGWVAKISGSRLIARDELVRDYLLTDRLLKSQESFYYLIQLESIRDLDASEIKPERIVVPIEEGVPVRRSWAFLRNTLDA